MIPHIRRTSAQQRYARGETLCGSPVTPRDLLTLRDAVAHLRTRPGAVCPACMARTHRHERLAARRA